MPTSWCWRGGLVARMRVGWGGGAVCNQAAVAAGGQRSSGGSGWLAARVLLWRRAASLGMAAGAQQAGGLHALFNWPESRL